MLKNVILRGVLFLIPIGIVLFVFLQVYKVAIEVAFVVDEFIPIQTVAGIGVANLLALLLIVLLCIVAGLISYISFINDKVQRMDRIFSNNVPGYSLIKGVLGAEQDDTYNQDALQPVLVTIAGVQRVGFETDRAEGKVVVFLPNEPSVVSGVSIVADERDVTRMNAPPRQVLSALQVHGKGLAPLLGTQTNGSA